MIELLVDKTDRLNQQAYKFEKSSRTLKSTMQWRRWRNIGIALVVVLLIILFALIMICGFKFERCQKKKSE